MTARKIVSNIFDASIVPGFSRLGFVARSQLGKWKPVSSMRLSGRTIAITGPTSGLGKATAEILAPTGAQLVLIGRNKDKCDALATALTHRHPDCHPVVCVAEMGDLKSVADAADKVRQQFPRIDVLVHNAGALLKDREVSQQGQEQTIASHVLGPHLMTSLLRNALRAANGRVVTVSSGGMYGATLPRIDCGESLEMSADNYDGTKQYAIAKRAQVTLNEMWAKEEPNIEFAAMHPGWADTPGVQDALPLFRTLTKPILRSAEQGADTIAWLAAVHPLPNRSGLFWSDREVRPIHKLPQTKKSDTASAREALWAWCNKEIQPFLV